jgi:hypothetical protein
MLPPLTSGGTWTPYRAVFTPDQGTTALDLFIYSSATSPAPALNDFANVRVVALKSVSPVDLVASPINNGGTKTLVVQRDAYSSGWIGPSKSHHVLVDGLENGWFIDPPVRYISTRYWPEDVVHASFAASALAFLIVLELLQPLVPWRRLRSIYERLKF